MRKIYIASSWKNELKVVELANRLRSVGYEAYAFCERGAGHFVFSPKDFLGDITRITAKEAMSQECFIKIYEANKDGLDWSDTVIIVLPAGKSTHLEGGYAVGCGKELFIWEILFLEILILCMVLLKLYVRILKSLVKHY